MRKYKWLAMGSSALGGYFLTRQHSESDRPKFFQFLDESFANQSFSIALAKSDSLNIYNPYSKPNDYQTLPYFNSFPRTQWHRNWDQRDPYESAEHNCEDPSMNSVKKYMPTAKRNIFFIRHGQYDLVNKPHVLTSLGREQAVCLGKKLGASGISFNRVVKSTMPRADETAELVLQQLGHQPTVKADSMLEEGAPYPPEPYNRFVAMRKYFVDGLRIEAAFRKYIHRASVTQVHDSYELIVCHGNVIRYFVCRALQFPPEGWLRMSLGHCSITWLVIDPDGSVHLRTLGDIGHLPPDKISFS